jgi:hypothetical protein
VHVIRHMRKEFCMLSETVVYPAPSLTALLVFLTGPVLVTVTLFPREVRSCVRGPPKQVPDSQTVEGVGEWLSACSYCLNVVL